ncbi:hypothetical protein HOP52_15880 [Halomonas campisalis]|uniref:Uncharacterized protein n=1 Tax=Billgrantia campisalis TaxID=74661 RepID=A0ABS9PBU6_9GAMM|nr:hypothetical protein [Halomonas campisalis]MCG6659238.1 hypothetical protein [Halomonas campisalis]MDR5864237.1 hypothetical protein [Halomonas campisalis]
MSRCPVAWMIWSPSQGGRSRRHRRSALRRLLFVLLLACWPLSSVLAQETLREEWGAEVARSPLAEPIHVASEERRYSISGSVHARINEPFDGLATVLGSVAAWCDILFLHPNVQACLHDDGEAPAAMQLYVGRLESPLAAAERLELRLRVTAVGENYLAIRLEGSRGPYGTREFLLHLQAIPDEAGHSLMYLRYSLAFGAPARLALRAYFALGGRQRVGFSVEAIGADGEPRFVGGVRGMIERNVMRFYLGLVVHLETLAVPEPERLDARLAGYFAATDRYPRQLRELDEASYLALKHRQHAAQQALRPR